MVLSLLSVVVVSQSELTNQRDAVFSANQIRDQSDKSPVLCMVCGNFVIIVKVFLSRNIN